MIGVYKIQVGEYIYIGQSIDIEERFMCHKRFLRKNVHCNKLIQSLYNENPNSISFEIIEECSIEELGEKEKYYIKHYNSQYILNIQKGSEVKRLFNNIDEYNNYLKQRRRNYLKNNKDHLNSLLRQKRKEQKEELTLKRIKKRHPEVDINIVDIKYYLTLTNKEKLKYVKNLCKKYVNWNF